MTEVMSKPAIDPKAFRRALGNFATGVTIITACAPDGTKVGVTASSFNSLSMDPPLILWSSMKTARSCAVFEAATHFAVNILASDQMEMSNHFARQQEDKFAGVAHEDGLGGAPIFPNCAGRFQCEAYDRLDGGDHWIFVGRVIAFDDFGRSPLCFHQGSYAMVYDHPDSFPKTDQASLPDTDRGRLGNHAFFLMLRAVRAYQDRYQPKMATLGLSVIEARILLVLNDFPALTDEELVVHLHTPETEAHVALINLEDRGLVAQTGERYTLTDAGQGKADQCWRVAEVNAQEGFAGFSPAQVDTFTEILRHLIG
ncbi:p-hydroxyphenylacetate 3-hydroxylase reductase component [Antarcticimicrobium sediminis]|nr:flavin reductase [Antarcticimicrobium sediminis]